MQNDPPRGTTGANVLRPIPAFGSSLPSLFATPVRVLIVCEHPSLNGGERSLLAVIPALIEIGFAIEIAAPGDGDLADAARLVGARVHPWHSEKDIAAVLRDRTPALVHVNGLAAARQAAETVAGRGFPAIAHLRDIVRVGSDGMRRLQRYDRLLAVSAATRDFHVGQGAPADRTFVVPNGVDVEVFRPGPATGWLHARLGLDANVPLAGLIGQLVQRKGQDVAIEAARMLLARNRRLHLVFAGERHSRKDEAIEYEARLRTSFDHGPLAGKGAFLGRVDCVEKLLPELTLLVHAARQEPLGRVLLEAGAAGTPIVATDVGGTREIFPPEARACELVPAGDPVALADAIERQLNDPLERTNRAARARQIIATRFSVPVAAACLADHYRAALSGGMDSRRIVWH